MRVIRRIPYKARRSGPDQGTMIISVPQSYVQGHNVEYGDDVFAFEDDEGRLVFEFKKEGE